MSPTASLAAVTTMTTVLLGSATAAGPVPARAPQRPYMPFSKGDAETRAARTDADALLAER